MAANFNYLAEKMKENGELVEEFAFDPNRKTMAVIWEFAESVNDLRPGMYILNKGAPETVLKICSTVWQNNQAIKLAEEKRKEIEKAYLSFAKQGLRIIALSFRPERYAVTNRDQAEKDLTFVGFVGIADPPRPEVSGAIKLSQKAGIKTVMVTGDNEFTANAIAEKIGLISQGEEIITGAQFAKMSDDEIRARVDKIRILARSTPQHKLRLVSLFQQAGQVVAVKCW